MKIDILIQVLRASVSPTKKGAKRQIVRMKSKADYRAFAKALQKTKTAYKKLGNIRLLPSINAFVFYGSKSGPLLKSFAGMLKVEEDVPLTVHGIPVPVSSGTKLVYKRPFVPVGIRSLRVPSVWKRSLGHRVRIGVIDTGVDFHHPDLQHALSRGINLVHPHTLPFDDNGHGTHIAGTIAASGRHAMKGIAPQAVLYPVKAFDHNGSAYVSDIIKGIEWCVQNGMHIINMSFGMKKRSQAMLEAVRKANRAGIIIVASSGNDGRLSMIDYPARYVQTISVGALNRRGRVASFSNRGRRVDVYAPGERITSTWPNRRYSKMNGTSMATSHVTGVLALLLAVRPSLTPAQLKKIVATAQVPLKEKRARKTGRIDAVLAFNAL